MDNMENAHQEELSSMLAVHGSERDDTSGLKESPSEEAVHTVYPAILDDTLEFRVSVDRDGIEKVNGTMSDDEEPSAKSGVSPARANGVSGKRSSSDDVPDSGHYIKRTETVRYLKQTVVIEAYYTDGKLQFQHPPETKEVETESPEKTVSVEKCTEDEMQAGKVRAKKEKMKIQDGPRDDEEVKDGVNNASIGKEPSEASSRGGSDISKRKRTTPATKRVEFSSDEEEDQKTSVKKEKEDQKTSVKKEKKARTPTPEEKFTTGMEVLARYSDNRYYPAKVTGKEATHKLAITYSDTRDQDTLHESQLLDPKEWLVPDREVSVKIGKGGDYEDAKITEVKEDPKGIRYVVEMKDSEKIVTVTLSQIALEEEEVLRMKFEASPARKNTGAYKEGAAVFANWPAEQRYFAGKIVKATPRVVDIEFLDGEKAAVPPHDVIIVKDLVKAGRSCLVKLPSQNFDKAEIISVTGDEDDTQVTFKWSKDHRQDRCHISEMAFSKKDVQKYQQENKESMDKKKKESDDKESVKKEPSERDTSGPHPLTSRPSRSQKLATPSQPIKVEQVKTETKTSAKKTSDTKKAPPSKKKKVSEPVNVSDDDEKDANGGEQTKEDSPVPDDDTVEGELYRIGKNTFRHNQRVFGVWDQDKRWYAGWIKGMRGSKFKVQWCENKEHNHNAADDIIPAKDVLHKGMKVNVIIPGKSYYDEVVLEEYMERGGHLVKSKKGQIFTKRFEEMMIQQEDVRRWRKKQSESNPEAKAASETKDTKAASTKSTERSAPATRSPPGKKRKSGSASPEPDSTTKPPASKKSRPSKVLDLSDHEDSPETEQVPQGPPFANCSFVITSGSEKEPTFERDYICKQVNEKGGHIVNTFDELVKYGGKRFLIAPSPCRTAKFLQCLAANIPCVSHKWILEIASANKMVDVEKYRLKTGKSSHENKMVDWKPRRTLLDNLKVALFGGSTFRSTWVPAFKAGKAQPTVLEISDVDSNMKRFDVVIVEDKAPKDLVDGCIQDEIPLVTVEWIIQTLIHGVKQDFNLWPYGDVNSGELDESKTTR